MPGLGLHELDRGSLRVVVVEEKGKRKNSLYQGIAGLHHINFSIEKANVAVCYPPRRGSSGCLVDLATLAMIDVNLVGSGKKLARTSTEHSNSVTFHSKASFQ